MPANVLNSTPISSSRSVWCAAVKSPCPIRSDESVSCFNGSSSHLLAKNITTITIAMLIAATLAIVVE